MSGTGLRQFFSVESKLRQIEEFNRQTEDPDFWTQERAKKVLKEKAGLERVTGGIMGLEQTLEDVDALVEAALRWRIRESPTSRRC